MAFDGPNSTNSKPSRAHQDGGAAIALESERSPQERGRSPSFSSSGFHESKGGRNTSVSGDSSSQAQARSKCREPCASILESSRWNLE